jgi:hypothetical protein
MNALAPTGVFGIDLDVNAGVASNGDAWVGGRSGGTDRARRGPGRRRSGIFIREH